MPTEAKTMPRPLGDRILLKPSPREETTKTGIVLPDTATEKPMEGTVLAVGKGRTLKNGEVLPLEIKVGDRVLYAKYSGTEVKLDNEDHLILSERDVLAIFES